MKIPAKIGGQNSNSLNALEIFGPKKSSIPNEFDEIPCFMGDSVCVSTGISQDSGESGFGFCYHGLPTQAPACCTSQCLETT